MGNSVTGILSFIFGLLGVFTAHWYVGIFFILVAVILGVIALTDYLSYKWSAISGLVLSGLLILLARCFHVTIDYLLADSLPVTDSVQDKMMLSLWHSAGEQEKSMILSIMQSVMHIYIIRRRD